MSVKFILSNTFGFSADNMYRLIAKTSETAGKSSSYPTSFHLLLKGIS